MTFGRPFSVQSFAHEREIRLIISRQSDDFAGPGGAIFKYDPTAPVDASFMYRCGAVPDEGLSLPVDPNVLIQTIHLAPDSANWIIEAVGVVVSSLG